MGRDWRSHASGRRGISKVLGVVLLVAITMLLVSTVAVVTTGVTDSAGESAAYHGTGTFNFDFSEADGDSVTVEPRALDSSAETTYELEINGHRVWKWNGHERLTLTCLYPGDRLLIRSVKGDTTDVVSRYEMNRSTRCRRLTAIDEKFEYAFVDGHRRQVLDDFVFDVEIGPDGPGSDRTFGRSVFQRDIGTVPVTNEWHYIRRYSTPIEGFSPPVWVIVMTDNVHWRNAGGSSGLNWTDEPPGEPGIDSYEISGDDLVIEPSGSEPTNDIYMVFKPGCSGSKLKIIDVSAGYHNRVFVNDQVAISNTYTYSTANPSRTDPPVVHDAPAVSCPGS